MSPTISISASSSETEAVAHDLAKRLQLPYSALSEEQIQLVVTPQRMEIRAAELGKPIFIDFEEGKNAHRRQFGGGRGQPLAKAIGLKKGACPSVIDATAGFGRDAFVLANLGCVITLIERQPLISLLLSDALNRAYSNQDLNKIISRMSLVNEDAALYLSGLNEPSRPDVIYMDPMYPSREKSALVKKDMRLLHQLAGPDTDSAHLLSIAQATAQKRVVVKRPKTASFVGNRTPSTSISSKNTRYDVYIC